MVDFDGSSATQTEDNPLFRLLTEYGRPYTGHFVVGFVAQVAGRIPGRVPAFLVGIAVDAVFLGTEPFTLPLVPDAWLPAERIAQLWFVVAVLVVAYFLDAFFDWVTGKTYGVFEQRLIHDLRTDTYDAMQECGVGFFESNQTGEIMSVLNNDINNLQDFAGSGLRRIARFSAVVAMGFAFMFVLNWQLALLLLFVPVVHAVVSRWFTNAIEPRYENVRENVGALNARLENNVNGISTIKAYRMEESEIRRVRDSSREYLETSWEAAKLRIVLPVITRTVNNAGFILAFVVGGYWVLRGPPFLLTGTVTPGAIVTFLLYARSFNEPVSQLVGVVDIYEDAHASSKRIVDLLESPTTAVDDGRDVDDVEGAVEYDEVSFSYDDVPDETLSNVDFTVDPGQTVAFVGPTGSGKSTIVKLLLRFYEVDGGTIRIDDDDVRDFATRGLRRSISYVSQDPVLLHGSIEENIAYGAPDADRDAVAEAARTAGAHEFIERLPDGYDSPVGERGEKLSGGQRQRIAIARAMLRDPSILVLDEATSHVDNETELLIQKNIREMTAGRTTFVVAHALSTVRDADTILVVDDGAIVERGTHDELLAADGLYANLWRVQVGETLSMPDSVDERSSEARTQEADLE